MTTPYVATRRNKPDEPWEPSRPRQGALYRCESCGGVWLHLREKPPEAHHDCGSTEIVPAGFAHCDTNGDVTPLDGLAESVLAALPGDFRQSTPSSTPADDELCHRQGDES